MTFGRHSGAVALPTRSPWGYLRLMRREFAGYSPLTRNFGPVWQQPPRAKRRPIRPRTRVRRPAADRLSTEVAVLSSAFPSFVVPMPSPAGFFSAASKPRLEKNWIWICPAVMLVVGMIDTACTLAALKMGVLIELNPVMALMIEKGGPLGLALYRSGVTLLGCGLLLWALRMYRDGRIQGSSAARTRGMVWFGQAVLVTAHLALAAWWTAWFIL